MEKSATIIGDYRYVLTRRWAQGRLLLFIMLNPSTADAETDDPTIRKCVGFAKAWEFPGIEVVNLYAYRSTEPKNLWKTTDPVGSLNDVYLLNSAKEAGLVVAAWGANAKPERVEKVMYALKCVKVKVFHLGLTKSGQPKHPLYIPYSYQCKPFNHCRVCGRV